MNPELVSQLRDIHTADAVSWWPPAPGWWLLAMLVLVLLAWAGHRVLARYRLHQRRKQMLGWVDHLNANIDPRRDPQAYLSTLNRIFKLIALRAFPDQPCAALSGQEWADFLIEKMAKSSSSDALNILATGPYDPAPGFDPAQLSDLARQWIKQHG